MSQHTDSAPRSRRAPRPSRWPGACALAAAAVLATFGTPRQASAATELPALLQRLATCEDSWLDWRRDQTRMSAFADALRAHFKPQDRSPVWVPLHPIRWLGAEVLEITPESIGMGLGFGITLKAPLPKLKAGFERAVGQPMKSCGQGDGMSTCESELAPKKTAMMAAPSSKPELGTLLGCYYYYQQ